MADSRNVLQSSIQTLLRIHPSALKEYVLFIDTISKTHPNSQINLELLDSAIRALCINLQVKSMYEGTSNDSLDNSVVQQIKIGLTQFYQSIIDFLNLNIPGINILLKHPMYAQTLSPIIKNLHSAGLENFTDNICEKPEYANQFAEFIMQIAKSNPNLLNSKTILSLTKTVKNLNKIQEKFFQNPTTTSQEFIELIRKIETSMYQTSSRFFSKSQTQETNESQNKIKKIKPNL